MKNRDVLMSSCSSLRVAKVISMTNLKAQELWQNGLKFLGTLDTSDFYMIAS